MPALNLALPPRFAVAPVATNGSMAAANKPQGHPDKFPCIECSEHFANAVDRATHLRAAHDIENGFLCHECVSSCSDKARDARHANDHYHSRGSPRQMTCSSLRCDYESSSTAVLERHGREDHARDDSHQAQCPECAYHNDSIVGVSVHMLHVHSEEGIAKRKEALRSIALAKAAAREAKSARIAAARAAADASSSTAASSSAETTPDTSSNESSPAISRKRAREMTREEHEEEDAKAANSNAFLESQQAALDAMTEDGRKEIFMTHRERKRLRVKLARERQARGA